MATNYGYMLDENGNATPISDPSAYQRGETVALAEDSNKLGGKPASEYLSAPASADTLGGVKVGEGLSIADDGTLSAVTPKILWQGTWSGGDITVPDQSKYAVFRISMEGQGTAILAVRTGTFIRGIGGYSSASPTISIYQFAATFVGDEWTFIACNSMQHKIGGNHGEITANVVTGIMGLL